MLPSPVPYYPKPSNGKMPIPMSKKMRRTQPSVAPKPKRNLKLNPRRNTI